MGEASVQLNSVKIFHDNEKSMLEGLTAGKILEYALNREMCVPGVK